MQGYCLEEEDKGVYIFTFQLQNGVNLQKTWLGEKYVLLIDEKAAELDHNQVEELHPLGKPSKKNSQIWDIVQKIETPPPAPP